MTAVAGIFETASEANLAYERLIEAGFNADKVSLVVSHDGKERVFNDETTLKQGAHDATKGALAGAAGVGALGALVAGLTALALPGAGILAAGPLAIALSGAGAGAVIGGLSGALVEAGFSKDDAVTYEESLEDGHAITMVHPNSSAQENAARTILAISGASATRAA